MYNGTIDLSPLLDFDVDVLKKTVSYLTQINNQIKIFSTLQSSIKTVQETMAALAPIFAKNAAEQMKANVASSAGAVAAQVDSAAKLTNASMTKAVTEASLLNSSAKVTETATTTATAGAYKMLNTVMTTSTGILGLIVVGITAVIAIGAALINVLGKGSKAFQTQKKEVEELADAQEELAKSSQESADAFADSAAHLEASGKVAQNLVGEMKAVSASTEDAATKHQKMAELCTKLNSAMDGLNIAYDKESGAIKDVNTGQEISLEQLDELVAAKAELAKADAWAERQNELLAEQVRIEEELAVIEQKRAEIENDQNLSDKDRKKLLDELSETETDYTAQKEENAERLAIVNENIANSSAESANQIVSDYEKMQSAVTSSGESLQQVADQWGVSTEDILAAMEAQGITLDEWVANQESAWEDYQAAVSEKTAAVVNSFQKIPDQFDMSGQQMLDNLMSNKERYAAWEDNMAEITRLLGPTAAEEFRKLGPEANSALEEILNTEGMLEQYAERKNGNGGGAKQAAERKKNALSMCGEVSSRHNTQGKKVDLVGGEKKGGVQQRWTKESFALGVLIY